MVDSRRRRYWIDLRSQGPFLLKIGSVWAAGVLLLCLLLYYLADEELGRSFYSIHLRLRNTWQILLPAVLVAGGVSYLVTIGATLLLAVRESHRLGGPIHKFRLLFRDLGNGVLDTGFHFRTGDILYDLGESYREALQVQADRIRSLQELGDRADRTLSEARLSLSAHGLPAEEMRLVGDSADALARLREALREFRIGPS
ncbi:MAG TPA: hypothetical protein VN450_01935 [Candidatus Methylomirabilis sp.]|nr:hypothetical protein [Candidatus Methylomirabilis sp.]